MKSTVKRLVLSSETLRNLTPQESQAVVGGLNNELKAKTAGFTNCPACPNTK